MLNPTLSPGVASGRDSWCISTDFTSVVSHVGGEGDDHAGLYDASLHTTHRDCSNTSNLVNVLQRKPKRFVCWSGGGNDGVQALPSFLSTFQPLYQDMLELVCSMLSPCHPEMGTNGTATGL